MEFLDQDFQSNANDTLRPTPSMRQSWYSISKWAQFLAIVGFILTGILLIAIGSLSTLVDMVASMMPDNPGLAVLSSMKGVVIGIFGVSLAIQLVLNYFHLQFALKLKRAVQFTDQEAFRQAWLNFRNLFRILGVLTAITLAIYLIAMIFVFVMYRNS